MMQRDALSPPIPAVPPARPSRWALNPRIRDWQGRRVWLVGASSGIGAALARELARRGARLALTARREEPLQALAAETGGTALVLPCDVTDSGAVERAQRRILDAWGGIDLVVWLAGTYAPMRAHQFDLAAALETLEANFASVYRGLAAVLPTLLAQGSGGLALVSSVAGYRGLPKSLAYGPTKAAMINLAETLWLDLHPRGIGVWLVSPGFVDTPLTAQNEFRMPALISAEEAASEIVEGLARGGFEIHFPKRFTIWLRLMRLLPYRLYFAAVRRFTGL